MGIHCQIARILAFALLATTAGIPAIALAGGSVVALTLKNIAPKAGEALQFAVGVSTDDPAGWSPNSYGVSLEIRNADGGLVSKSEQSTGDTKIAAGQTVVLFATVAGDALAKGTFRARAVLRHLGAIVDQSDPQAIAIGAIALDSIPPDSQAIGSTSLDGSLATNLDIAQTTGESGALTLSGKGGASSFTTTGGLSTSAGASNPLISFQTPQSQLQVGTFAPSFDPISFDGATGNAAAFKHVYSPQSALQLAFINGARDTENPYSVAAVSMSLPVKDSRSIFSVTSGIVSVSGAAPLSDGVPFLNNGWFISSGLTHSDPKTTLVYGLHYGIMNYTDKLTLRQRTDNVFEATSQFSIGKAGWDLEFMRASAFYPTVTASAVTPDRLNEKIGVNVPIGRLSASVAANGYSDDLPGALLSARTHFWTESVNLSMALRSGDTLSYAFSGATQHQAADLNVAPTAADLATATDASIFTYAATRGAVSFGSTLGYNNQRDSTNNLQHTTQFGLNLGRNVSTGLTVGAYFQLTNNVSNAAMSTNTMTAAALTLAYSSGPFTLSSAVSTSRTRPLIGMRPFDTSALNFGVGLKLSKNLGIQATFTQNTSGSSTQTGSLNVTQNF